VTSDCNAHVSPWNETKSANQGLRSEKVPLLVVSQVQVLQPFQWTGVYHQGIVCVKESETDVWADKRRRDCLSRTGGV
jgi:hypothetical protein